MFSYCGNSSVNYTDPAGNFHRSFSAQINALFYEGSGGIAGLGSSTYGVRNGISAIKDYIFNEEESKVLEAQSFAFYKGTPVIKVPGNSAFSFGVIFFGSDINSLNLVRHEYGHARQLKELGIGAYCGSVVIPSVTCFWLTEYDVLSNELYYSLPWEYMANIYGNASGDYALGADIVAQIYWGIARILSGLV